MVDTSLLGRILAPGSLTVRFQPVLDVRGARPRLHYVEALIRGPAGTTAECPTILFDYARKKNKEAAVDRACVRAILEAARDLPRDTVLGVNVHASSLAMDAGFTPFLLSSLEAAGIPPARAVVEIVEHAPPWDAAGLRSALGRLRSQGVRIALDDVGLGHSNYRMILECQPDYFKVDRHFVNGCHRDFQRRAVLTSIALLARLFRGHVIAEGVEKPSELTALTGLGIHLVQGFLFGRPAPAALFAESPRARRPSGERAVAAGGRRGAR